MSASPPTPRKRARSSSPPASPPRRAPTPAPEPEQDRGARVAALAGAPMRPGETWFVVSAPWHARFAKDPGAPLPPVDNSSLLDPATGLLAEGAGGDAAFVPRAAWDLLVAWYGAPLPGHTIARQVITRGARAEAALELHPPRVRLLRAARAPPANASGVEFHATLSASLSGAPLAAAIAAAIDPALATAEAAGFRVWRAPAEAAPAGTTFGARALARAGATLLSSEDNEAPQNGDVYVLEARDEANNWLIDKDAPPPPPTPPPRERSPERATPMFGSGAGAGFFDRFGSAGAPKEKEKSKATGVGFFKSSQPEKPRTPGTLGLGNLGNTCFMNSALQCLAHTRELADYFLADVHAAELNTDNPLGMGGAVASAFGQLLARIWDGAPGPSSYAPRDFKSVLGRFAPQFSGYQQHDSQELVAFLLDGLHEDLNRVLKKPYVEKPDWNGGGDREMMELARESWAGYVRRNDSVIVDLFQSMYRSTLVCPDCDKVSVTFDPYMYLTLPLPIRAQWRHTIHFVPAAADKPHARVPLEVPLNATFRDVRALLARWMGAPAENLATLEVFNSHFYRTLHDGVPVSDMAENDAIVCYELPCAADAMRPAPPPADAAAAENDEDDDAGPPFVVSVLVARASHSSYSRTQHIGTPMLIAIPRAAARSVEGIERTVVDAFARWTKIPDELYSREEAGARGAAGVDGVDGVDGADGADAHMSMDMDMDLDGDADLDMEEVRVPDAVAPPLAEIRPDGGVVLRALTPPPEHTAVPEDAEGDIADTSLSGAEEALPAYAELTDGEPRAVRRTGVKPHVFTLRLMPGVKDFGAGNFSGRAADTPWAAREVHGGHLLRPDDQLVLELDENMVDYFLGTDTRADWVLFEHGEYVAMRAAAVEQKKRSITLQDCLAEFVREEQLGADDPWFCPGCKTHVRATKKFDLWGAPDVLVVHLKRFSSARAARDKIDARVEFPIEGLDLTDMAMERKVRAAIDGEAPQDDERLVYDLFAVDEHIGGLGGGHYRAYALNHTNEQWYHFDDSHVSTARAEESVNPNAYLLFYRRRTARPLGGPTQDKIAQARAKAAEDAAADARGSVSGSAMDTDLNAELEADLHAELGLDAGQLPTPPSRGTPPRAQTLSTHLFAPQATSASDSSSARGSADWPEGDDDANQLPSPSSMDADLDAGDDAWVREDDGDVELTEEEAARKREAAETWAREAEYAQALVAGLAQGQGAGGIATPPPESQDADADAP